jgi:hypothetical protein
MVQALVQRQMSEWQSEGKPLRRMCSVQWMARDISGCILFQNMPRGGYDHTFGSWTVSHNPPRRIGCGFSAEAS